MGKKTIKLRYVDSMSKNYKEEILWKLLTDWYIIDEISEPDYIIHGGMGSSFVQYKDCVKIQIIGENIVPDFNVFDYAIGFDYIIFEDRYVRVPLYYFYDSYHKLLKKDNKLDMRAACNRKFCSFVVSNAKHADPTRDAFFETLSKYKRVDSAGRHLNNMGGTYLKDKLDFISKYKFNIAFENCSSVGYTTEKIMEPMAVNTIPIYWGNPRVGEDFNKNSFICLNDFETVEECIDYIKILDNDDNMYYEKLNTPCILDKKNDYYNELKLFFTNIFDQDKQEAKRVNKYGHQVVLTNKLLKIYQKKDAKHRFKDFIKLFKF